MTPLRDTSHSPHSIWEDTSGRGVRGPVYNTVENANWHRTCAYTPYTYTVAHAPKRADFTRDFTSAVSCRATGAGRESAGDPVKIIASEVFSFFFGNPKSANRSFFLLREGEFFGCLRK